MSATDAVTVSVYVAVDPAAAFEVFTEEVDLWWKKGPQYRFVSLGEGRLCFEPDVGGRLVHLFDDSARDPYEVGRISIWEPGERLVFDWRLPNFAADQSTEVEVRFAADGDGTRVTLEHRGWDRIPLEHPARHGLPAMRFAQMKGNWWVEQCRAYRNRAESPKDGW